jgi:hypothetical protein
VRLYDVVLTGVARYGNPGYYYGTRPNLFGAGGRSRAAMVRLSRSGAGSEGVGIGCRIWLLDDRSFSVKRACTRLTSRLIMSIVKGCRGKRHQK